MIHFIPDRLIPQRFVGINRRYLNECISLISLLIFCITALLAGVDPAEGLLPESWGKIRELLHGGPAMCPFCGGTRSFLFMCRGEIVTAAHYNFFAILFFFTLFIHIFLKIWVLCRGELPKFPAKVLKLIDSSSLQIILLFVLWGVQLLLHFTGIFLWYTVAPAI